MCVYNNIYENNINSEIIVNFWFGFITVSFLIRLLVDIKSLPNWMISPLS